MTGTVHQVLDLDEEFLYVEPSKAGRRGSELECCLALEKKTLAPS